MIELKGVSKSFMNVDALSDVNIAFQEGEIHALIGSNGAGKTSLVNILSGRLRPTSGRICIDGREVSFSSPADASREGIAICTQQPEIVEQLTIAENIFLGHERRKPSGLLDKRAMEAEAARLLAMFSLDCRPSQKAKHTSHAEKYIIQFLRLFIRQPRMLLLDELTESLTFTEANIVFAALRRFRDAGAAILFVTHRIGEAMEKADKLSVLRDGAIIETITPQEAQAESLSFNMLGENIREHYPKIDVARKDVVLEAYHISNRFLDDVSFHLHRGEVLGIAGLAGSGRSSLLRAIVGIDKVDLGRISIHLPSPAGRRKRSPSQIIGYMPENRNADGIFPHMSIAQNITIRNLAKISRYNLLSSAAEGIACRDLADTLGIRMKDIHMPINQLSDGNMQKALVARNLYANCNIYVFDEPTKGVDSAGKIEIYNIINELTRNGASILLVSSDFSELAGMCNRVIAIKKGRLVAEFGHEEVSEALFAIFTE